MATWFRVWSFSMHTIFSLYFSIQLFSAIGYFGGILEVEPKFVLSEAAYTGICPRGDLQCKVLYSY